MADQIKKVLLEVSMKEQDKVLADAAGLKKQIDELTSAQKKYLDIQKEKGFLNEKEAVEVERIKSQISNLKKEYNEVQRVASAYNQVQTREIGSYKQLNALIQIEETKLKNLEGTLQRNADGSIILTDAYVDQKKVVEELNKKRIEFDQGISVGRTNVGNYSMSIVEANQRIKELQTVIETSDMGSQEFIDAKNEADKLKLSVDQALGKVDEFGNREPRNPAKKTFDDAFESTVALSGAIGIVTSLMGEESDVSKQLAEAMKAVAIAQSAANILKAKGAILDTAEIVSKKIQIGLQRTYTMVVGETTGALKALRIALAATGLGLFVLGIAAVVSAISKKKDGLTDVTDTQTTAQEKLTAAIQKTQQAIQDIKDQFNNPVESPYAQQILDLQRIIDLRSAQGADDIEISKKEIELANLKIKNLQTISDALESQGLAGQTTTIELQNEIDDLKNQIAINNAEIINSEKEKQKELNDIADQNMELRIKTQTDGFREELLLFDLEAKKRLQKAYEDGLDMQLVQKDIDQQRLALIDEHNAAIGEMLIDTKVTYQNTEMDITEFINAQLKKRQDDFKASQDAKKEMLTQEFEFTKDMLVSIGQAFADSIDETGIQLEQFARDLITLLLDVLEKQITMAIAKTITDAIAASVLTPIKLLEAAGKIALITAAFESAKAVINRPPKFEDGGSIDIGGKRHADGGTKFVGSDGTTFEAEAGEKLFIVNRGASAFLDRIGSINNAFKSKSYHSRPNYLQDGGFVQRRLSGQGITANEIERAMIKAVMQLPPSKLIISELKEKNDSLNNSVILSEL